MARNALDRSSRTLRTMLAQHSSEGRNPSLQAVTTIYQTLLTHDAGSDLWLLFAQVAELPLTVRHFVPECKVNDGHYTFGGRWSPGVCNNYPHCAHRNIEQTKLITLEAPRDMVAEGRLLHAQQVAGWWGRQLADAMAVEFTAR